MQEAQRTHKKTKNTKQNKNNHVHVHSMHCQRLNCLKFTALCNGHVQVSIHAGPALWHLHFVAHIENRYGISSRVSFIIIAHNVH